MPRREEFRDNDEGYIAIPDFWRASQCFLYHLDEQVDRFEDDRKGLGFEFQIEVVGEDLQAGKKQSARVPLAFSLKLQEHMAAIREACQE